MQDMRSTKYLWLSILFNTCLIFTVGSFILSLLTSAILTSAASIPNVKVNIITLVASVAISIIIAIICAIRKRAFLSLKINFLYLYSISYTILFIIYYAFVSISSFVKPSIFSILTILCVSLLFAIFEVYVNIKSALIKALIYLIVFSIPYLTVVFISNLAEGNKIFIIIAIYLVSFILIYLIYFICTLIWHKHTNETKDYTKLFK